MTSNTVGVASERPGGVFPKISRGTRASYGSIQDPETHFREEWMGVESAIGEHRESPDVSERLDRDPFDRALDLAVEYPEYVDVSSQPVDVEEPDMVEHVRNHFDAVFNERTFVPAHRAPIASNFRTLIRACEIVYLDDAVLRFTPRWVFDPAFEELPSFKMNELPDQLSRWMEQAQLMWDALEGTVDLSKRQIDGLVETLYSSRTGFVETAMEMDLFLPISPPGYEPGAPDSNLRTKFTRDHEIDSTDVHRYCYRRVLENY